MQNIRPTEEQHAMIESFVRGESFIGEAVAGSGKSSTIRMMVEAAQDKKILCLAFNADIVSASKKRAPVNVDWKTIHGLAYQNTPGDLKERLVENTLQIWMAYENYIAGNEELRSRIDRIGKARRELYKEKTEFYDRDRERRKSINILRNTIVRYEQSEDQDFNETHFPELTKHQLMFKAMQSGLDKKIIVEGIIAPIVEVAATLWKESIRTESVLPITHNTYLKLFGLMPGALGYDAIIVDEAQDVMPIARRIIDANVSTQKIWIGDGNQQIYGWNGARNIMRSLCGLRRMTLSQSFRYGPALAEYANKILAVKKRMDIGAFVQEIRGTPEIETKVHTKERREIPDVVIARTNAGVLEAAIELIEAGRKVHVVGGIGPFKTHLLEAYKLKTAGKVEGGGTFASYGSWRDLVEFSKSIDGRQFGTTVRLVEKYQNAVPELVAAIEQYVGRKGSRNVVTVTTGHKAKGLEWQNVRIHEDVMPFVTETGGMTIYAEEEANLMYVMATRAREEADIYHLHNALKTTWDLVKKNEK